MSQWYTWDDYRTPLRRRKPRDPWSQPWPKTPSQPQKPEVTTKGFDGKRITLELQSTSAASSSSGSADGPWKDMLKSVMNGNALSEEQMRLLDDSPRQLLKDEQKKLNEKRKAMNRERTLQNKLKENHDRYNNWVATQKLLMKQEKERYETEQAHLEKELEKIKKMEIDAEEEEVEETDAKGDPAVLERVLAAESRAWEAQQAMLAMQSQMQQLVAMTYQGQLHAQAAAAVPSTGPSEAFDAKADSPQLPKSVIKNNLKDPPRHARERSPRKGGKKTEADVVISDQEERTAGL